jgi:hypothetical protein
MTSTKPILFAELRRLLQGLGYKEKRTDKAIVFHRAKAHLLLFRRYGEDEVVDAGDIVSTRKFLDAWGLLDAGDFDTFVESASSPA